VAAPPSRPAAAGAPVLPATPAGAQARWLLGQLTHLPIPTPAIEEHFASSFLAEVPPARLNEILASVGPLRLEAVRSPATTPDAVSLVASTAGGERFTVQLYTGAGHLIVGLWLLPVLSPPKSWAALDRELASIAPSVHLLVARLRRGACVQVHAVDPAAPAPLGSAFKLYVLDALAAAVAAHRASWGGQLRLSEAVKSLPSGTLQDEAAGTRLSVLQAATAMISISDNTAADLLIHLVGVGAVEQATRSAGMAHPGLDVPFLTTRQLFVLKLVDWPRLAERYLSLPAPARAGFLAHSVDTVSRRELLAAAQSGPAWTAPRDVDSIEWFGSADDVCRAFAALLAASRRPGLGQLARVLEVNDGGLHLDPKRFAWTWFKGGSEPGVLTLNYLAATTAGATYEVSVLVDNPGAPLGASSTVQLLGVVSGAFSLAAAAPGAVG